MSDFDGRRHTTQGDDLVTLVELVGLARREPERNEDLAAPSRPAAIKAWLEQGYPALARSW